MTRTDADAMEHLNRYWDEAVRGRTAAADVDPALAATVQRLTAADDAPAPDPAFAAQLWQRLLADAPSGPTPNGRATGGLRRWPVLVVPPAGRWWPLAGLATAAVLVLALAGVVLWAARPDAASAAQIVERSQAVVADVAAAGVRSFALSEVLTAQRGSGETLRAEAKRWYAAPNRWRWEYDAWVVAPDGQERSHTARLSVSDGTDLWQYDPLANSATVSRADPGQAGQAGLVLGGPDTNQEMGDLADLLKRASTCSDLKLRGEGRVAGRLAYVVDLGPSKCPSASMPEFNGRQVLWIDRETFFVLRAERYSAADGSLLSTREVTSIQYNGNLPDALFTFAPPPGAVVRDARPKPAPAADEFGRRLAELAGQADFPVFVPRQVPSGLVPRQPRLDPQLGLQLEYVPPEEAATDAPAQRNGLSIMERRATYAWLTRWTEQAEPVLVPAGKGWLRRGVRNPDGTGSNSAVIVLRDGALISIASLGLAPEQLLQVAASLEPVSGGHSPLPDPPLPTLAAIRQRVSFPVFVPTWVPDGLTPEPPVGGEQSQELVELTYHTADGAVALRVVNGPAGCCLDDDPRKTGQAVALPNGLMAHYLPGPPEHGGPILWWQQEGAYLALSGPHLTKDELVRIAASMSRTADLGRTETPAARPTPTPLPALGFPILRPAWLPEPMTVREAYVPNPNGPGSGVVLSFDPRPGDQPHELLTLREFPKDQGPAPVQDPQATREQIGGREVTIGRRGEGCVTASWVQGDAALLLTNPYDPPGPPGAVRYSCEQFRRIIESIR